MAPSDTGPSECSPKAAMKPAAYGNLILIGSAWIPEPIGVHRDNGSVDR